MTHLCLLSSATHGTRSKRADTNHRRLVTGAAVNVRKSFLIFCLVCVTNVGHSSASVEYVHETCVGATKLAAATNICMVTDLKTMTSHYEVSVAVGLFADNQVAGVGLEGHSALVAR